jgi:methionyl-tRNA synthetase
MTAPKPTSFYITTAIDYSNSVPHVGHAFEKIGADVIARYRRLMGDDVFFLLGTDEHSQNVKKMAENQGISPLEYCNQMAEKFKRVWDVLGISYTRFIQTTEKEHERVVQQLLNRIHQKGDIYKATYEGIYCPSCEGFLDEADLDDQGHCKIHGIPVEKVKEENYFFKLTQYQDALVNHIQKHPQFIQPETRRNEILAFIHAGLKDISISRQGSDWGIRLPFDSTAVAYVWVDALINYITGLGGPGHERFEKYWPPNLHVIGKDITRFHCIIWPCMLMSAEISLPETIWGHGFVHTKGTKMSKTKGTGINPVDLAQTFSSDALRYYLMREIHWDKDGDFSESRLVERHNAELSDGIGNLASRIHAMVVKYFDGKIQLKRPPSVPTLVGQIQQKLEGYFGAMEAFNLSEGLETCCQMVRDINVYIDQHKPWVMAKNPDQRQELLQFMHETVSCTLVTSACLLPFCPQKMEKVMGGFAVTPNLFQSKEDFFNCFGQPQFEALTPFSAVFPRLELPKE